MGKGHSTAYRRGMGIIRGLCKGKQPGEVSHTKPGAFPSLPQSLWKGGSENEAARDLHVHAGRSRLRANVFPGVKQFNVHT